MILRTRFGNREIRAAGEWGPSTNPPGPGWGWISQSGVPVTQAASYGVPAISNVIRSPAEIIASLPFIVYSKGDIRERAEGSWQWDLLHENPNEECGTFEFFYDLALSLEATQNAFLQKAKFNGRVFALYVLDPQRVTVRRDRQSGAKLFDVWVNEGRIRRDIGADEILHVRGFSPNASSATAGVSLLQLHRDPIGSAIAMQKFEGDYFRNSALSPLFFQLGERGSEQQAQAMLDAYKREHQGPGSQFKVGAVWGGTTVQQIPLSLDDAMFAEAKKLSIEDACRIWRWPKQLLELAAGDEPADENAWTARFLKFYLLPRLKRIERAFAKDPDLFGTASLFGEFLTSALERADFVTRVRGYKDARQGSWITANEIRRMENLPPVDGGDEILITPTGSAPNPDRAEPEPERSLNGHSDSLAHRL